MGSLRQFLKWERDGTDNYKKRNSQKWDNVLESILVAKCMAHNCIPITLGG